PQIRRRVGTKNQSVRQQRLAQIRARRATAAPGARQCRNETEIVAAERLVGFLGREASRLPNLAERIWHEHVVAVGVERSLLQDHDPEELVDCSLTVRLFQFLAECNSWQW